MWNSYAFICCVFVNQEREDERPLCWETKKAVSLVFAMGDGLLII